MYVFTVADFIDDVEGEKPEDVGVERTNDTA
jgi:hypothetical protein